jgi:hypothetical protein
MGLSIPNLIKLPLNQVNLALLELPKSAKLGTAQAGFF